MTIELSFRGERVGQVTAAGAGFDYGGDESRLRQIVEYYATPDRTPDEVLTRMHERMQNGMWRATELNIAPPPPSPLATNAPTPTIVRTRIIRDDAGDIIETIQSTEPVTATTGESDDE